MFTNKQLEQYFELHCLSPDARDYVRMTRNQPPSRKVGTNRGSGPPSVCENYVSTKMGHTIQAESQSAEYPLTVKSDYDSKCLELWDQPASVTVDRIRKNNVKQSRSYHPDLLVLMDTGPIVYEAKTTKDIQQLLSTSSSEWQRVDDVPVFLPALHAFNRIGLTFRVYEGSPTDTITASNLVLLMRSRTSAFILDPDFVKLVLKTLYEKPCMRLDELSTHCGVIDQTPLIKLIDQGVLHARLDQELLSRPQSAWVTTSPEYLNLPEFMVENTTGVGQPAQPISCESLPNQLALSRGLYNFDKINSDKSTRRSKYRWKNKILAGATEGKSALMSIVPAWYRCGNRSERFNDIQRDFFTQFVHERYATPMRLPKYRAYKLYEHLAKEVHPQYMPIGRSAFERRLSELTSIIAEGRGGKRAANAAATVSAIDDRNIRPTRPFECASIDHYKADIFCIVAVSGGKIFSARPWITVMVDRCTSAILAIWISFRSPSRRACAMIIRRCVRDHGRLPESIVVDHGVEFESNYFNALLADKHVNKISRPVAHPRYGSEAERFFGELKTQWLALRPGNIANMVERRGISSTHSSEANAELRIEDLLQELLTYCDSRNSHLNGTQLRTPKNSMDHGLAMFPFSGIAVNYDEQFQLATAVETKQYTVDPQRGIHLPDFWYWHPKLSQLGRTTKSKVEVREEPEDPFRIYALVDGEWVTCRNIGDHQFEANSPLYQLAEAIRILDGRSARKRAQDEADAHLLESIRIADERLNATQVHNQTTLALPEPAAINHFTSARNTSIEQLETLTWEKDYALGN